jgi:hypothetical protein
MRHIAHRGRNGLKGKTLQAAPARAKESQEGGQSPDKDKNVVKKWLSLPDQHTASGAGALSAPQPGRMVMNATVEQSLMSKIRTLSPQQVAEVEDFVEFLATKTRKQRALDRLLAIAPALEAAGAAPMSEDDIAAEVDAVRAERRVREAGSTSKDSGANRS